MQNKMDNHTIELPQFSKTIKGYNKIEVDEYIQKLLVRIIELETIIVENKRIKNDG